MPATPRLRCLETGEDYPVRNGAVIGRDADCDIILDTREVSRRHARVLVSGDRVGIEDLGSTNGLKVRGRQVPRVRLDPGQVVVLGDRTLMLIWDDADADTTVLGANLPDESASSLLDDPGDDATAFRANYALPAGWDQQEYHSQTQEPGRHEADLKLLRDLLGHRGIGRDRAGAAFMTLGQRDAGKVLLLETAAGPVWGIGRAPGADVRLDHFTVSQHHATITESAQGWLLFDADSTNGTRVNGTRVVQTLLAAGDVIEFGNVKVVFDVVA